MLISILLILIAWFVEMPLWLSVLITVFSGIVIIIRFLEFCLKIVKAMKED